MRECVSVFSRFLLICIDTSFSCHEGYMRWRMGESNGAKGEIVVDTKTAPMAPMAPKAPNAKLSKAKLLSWGLSRLVTALSMALPFGNHLKVLRRSELRSVRR